MVSSRSHASIEVSRPGLAGAAHYATTAAAWTGRRPGCGWGRSGCSALPRSIGGTPLLGR